MQRGRWPLVLLFAGAAVLLLPSLGAAPIERAEIYFLDVGRAMVETGDWVVPRYEGQPFFDKPALTYWLMAAAFRTFGFHLGTARAVPVTAALAVLAATVWMGARLFGRSSATSAGIVLTTTLLFLSFARVAMSDMLLSLWCTLAVGCALGAGRLSEGKRDLAWTGVGAALGLGFLTKGPIALVLAGAGLVTLFAFGPRPSPPPPTRRGSVGATAAFVVLGLGWFVAVWHRLGGGPLAYFFLHENLGRFAGETYDTGRSPVYYLWAFLAVGLPWSLVFPVAAARTWRDTRWLLLWMAAMVVPLSLARGKIDYYLLPLLPAASLVVGHYLAATAWTAVDRLWARGVLVAAAAGFATLPALEARLPVEWLPSAAAQVTFVAVVAAAALFAGLAAMWPDPRRLVCALAGGTSGVALVAVGLFLPAFRARQPNAEVVVDVARELVYRPDAHVVACGDPTRARRDLLFGVRVVVQERCDVWSPASSHIAFLMLVQKEQRLALASVQGIREVAEYRGLPATALTLSGFLAGLEPETFVLLANYPTSDPVAETKRKRDRKRALRAEEGMSP